MAGLVELLLERGLPRGSWRDLERVARRQRAGSTIVLDCRNLDALEALDSARLLRLIAETRAAGVEIRLSRVGEAVRHVLEGVPSGILDLAPRGRRRNPLEVIGVGTIAAIGGTVRFGGLLRETVAGLARPFGRHGIKWSLAVHQMLLVGVRATPVVMFVSFLIGVVLALNGALQLRQFGASIFIADLVAVSMTRQMGPLITAILVSGRTGSAIAAEIGTMVVSEEIDALRTMALNPARFLVVPKVLALAVMLPLLTVMSNAAGIFGGYAIGVLALDLPSEAYTNQTVRSLFLSDVLTGLIKSAVFAVLIGLVGAYRGFSVRGGPEAVGHATTSAVVTSIIVCIVANAGFTAFFYYVG